MAYAVREGYISLLKSTYNTRELVLQLPKAASCSVVTLEKTGQALSRQSFCAMPG